MGAKNAGLEVDLAIDLDKNSGETYRENHKNTQFLLKDVRSLTLSDLPRSKNAKMLVGGPPCQGFSTSNQRNRSLENPNNKLVDEYLRIVKMWKPDIILFENVKGFPEACDGFFLDRLIHGLDIMGYNFDMGTLNAVDFGVPQIRNRFFVIGSMKNTCPQLPVGDQNRRVSVKEAFSGLPILENGASVCYKKYAKCDYSEYSKSLMDASASGCFNHLVTQNSKKVIERYRHIKPGGNWTQIPANLMQNYKDRSRCHTGIYRRLEMSCPSVVIGNYRKNMLIHPSKDRGLSVREAARLQSFPDSYKFTGSIGFQQQQVANAVPPLLSSAIFKQLLKLI